MTKTPDPTVAGEAFGLDAGLGEDQDGGRGDCVSYITPTGARGHIGQCAAER